jgi:hypothetical protein
MVVAAFILFVDYKNNNRKKVTHHGEKTTEGAAWRGGKQR